MGFGNALFVDKSVYEKYKPYLIEEVKKVEDYTEEDDGTYNYCFNFPVWDIAIERMVNDEVGE
jgi:hypothetical protein